MKPIATINMVVQKANMMKQIYRVTVLTSLNLLLLKRYLSVQLPISVSEMGTRGTIYLKSIVQTNG